MASIFEMTVRQSGSSGSDEDKNVPSPGVVQCISEESQMRRTAEAQEWFEYALSLEGNPQTMSQAEAAYLRCLDLDPEFACAHINVGTVYYHMRKYTLAEGHYADAAELDPDYALAWFNLGNVCDETGRLDEAIERYKVALRLCPDYADAHYNIALVYLHQGRERLAIPHWESYLESDKTSAWGKYATVQLAVALRAQHLTILQGGKPPKGRGFKPETISH